jgi:hypothetical protein
LGAHPDLAYSERPAAAGGGIFYRCDLSTGATRAGTTTPRAMVANDDLALGPQFRV